MRITTNTTGSTTGTTIGIGDNGFSFHGNEVPNQPLVFLTNDGTAGGSEVRMLISAENINGFVGLGNALNFTPDAQLHINTIGSTGALPAGSYGRLFRTDGNPANNNTWSMWTGNAPAAVTNEVFNLTVPANTNNLQVNTVQNNGVIQLQTTNGLLNNIMTVTSTGSSGSTGLPAFAIGGVNIRPVSTDNNHFMNIGGPIRFSEASNLMRTTLMYGYTTCNGDPGALLEDGFRVMYEPNMNGTASVDGLVFQKTDGNNPFPDGSIQFTNMGAVPAGSPPGTLPIETVTMILDGTGNVGVGNGFVDNVMPPWRRLEVFDATGPQFRLANSLNANQSNEIFTDFQTTNTGNMEIDPRNAGLAVGNVRSVRINYGLGNAAPFPNLSLDVNGQVNIRTVNPGPALTQFLVWEPTTGNVRSRTISLGGTLGNDCTQPQNPLTGNWQIPTDGFNFSFTDPAILNDFENFVGIGTTCTPQAKLHVNRAPTTNTSLLVVGALIENNDVALSPAFTEARGTWSNASGQNKLNHGVYGEATNASTNYGLSGWANGSMSVPFNMGNYGVKGTASEGATNTGVSGEAFSSITSSTVNNYGGAFGSSNSNTNGTALQNIGVTTVADNGTTVWDNIGVFGVAINQLTANSTNNVGVAGISQGPGTATFDIGVYGEGVTAAYFTGAATIAGPLTFASDRKIKDNIKTIDKGMDLLRRLNPVTYNYKSDQFPELHLGNKLQYGFIAQEVEQVIPELVSLVNKPEFKDKDGKVISKGDELIGLNYVGLIPLLVKGIQEQQKQIDELKEMLRLNNNIGQPTGQNSIGVELSNANSIVLNQNVPNPFAEQTTITFILTEGVKKAQMLFYDASGRLINSVELPTTTGKGQLNVFANDLSTGAYTYALVVDGKVVDTKKMIKE